MSKKRARWSNELVQDYLDEHHEGFVLIGDYVGGNGRVSIQCPTFHIRDIRWESFIGNKNKCLTCLKEEKYRVSLNTFERLIEESEYSIIEHIQNKQALVQCSRKHEPYLVLFTNFNKGHRCPHCAGVVKLTYDQARMRVEEYGYQLISSEYKSVDSNMAVICSSGHSTKTSLTAIARGQSCKECSVENRSGESHHRWKGGISTLHEFLRMQIGEWKRNSMASSDYRCEITNEKSAGNIEVHHKYPFNKIVVSMLMDLELDIRPHMNMYTSTETERMKAEIQKRHMNLLGAPLLKEVHLLFHLTFGFGDNTVEQYEFFKHNYKEIKEGSLTSDDFITLVKLG